MHKRIEGRFFESSKRAHFKNNLKTGFRAIRINPLNSSKVSKRPFKKTVLEEDLIINDEKGGKSFLGKIEERGKK